MCLFTYRRYYFQNDYSRHPVLSELFHKYGVTGGDQVPLPARLDELREKIRKDIRKELKIKAGAEKIREASTDRKVLSDVAMVVKKANSKLNELQAELQQLESQIILTQGQPQSPQRDYSNGQGNNEKGVPYLLETDYSFINNKLIFFLLIFFSFFLLFL